MSGDDPRSQWPPPWHRRTEDEEAFEAELNARWEELELREAALQEQEELVQAAQDQAEEQLHALKERQAHLDAAAQARAQALAEAKAYREMQERFHWRHARPAPPPPPPIPTPQHPLWTRFRLDSAPWGSGQAKPFGCRWSAVEDW